MRCCVAGATRKSKGGFVVGPDPREELDKLRSILLSSSRTRASRLAQNIRESRERALAFAERDVAAVLDA